MIKRISGLILLVVMMICSVSLTVTYSKYLLSKSVSGEVTTKANCLDMGITSLGECMLVMDSNVNNVESAKLYISSKVADLTKTAPLFNYSLRFTEVSATTSLFSALNYRVTNDDASILKETSETGMFNYDNYSIVEMDESYIGYYTCGGNYNICDSIYKIVSVKYDESTKTYKIVKAIKYYYAVDSFDSEIGLYATDDDYGTSYYYRGNVKNNFVSYAGYIWRIVRQNGDGSIRLIYAGTKASTDVKAEVTIGSSRFNDKENDPTYSGYMYGKNFTNNITSTTAGFSRFYGTTSYYFADSYEFNDETKKYSLKGNIVAKVWKDDYSEIISKYPYSCLSTSELGTCDYVIKINKYIRADTMGVQFISYSSKDYASTTVNSYDSTIKSYIDTWYENNILVNKDSNGILYSDYLSDSIFCDDRSIYSGNGYSLIPSTNYNGYIRAQNYSPDLKCTNFVDKFTVSSVLGNGDLKYPIALLTVDEAIYAGEVFRTKNGGNYLTSSTTTVLLSPSFYFTERAGARVFYLKESGTNGSLYSDYVTNNFYVRPVINLRSDIQITGGDGTAESPYIVSL